MNYQCVAAWLEGFIQQLACASMRHGYVHFVRGAVPLRTTLES